MKKLRIVLLYGGVSAERAVSLNTGRMIAKNLDRTKYAVTLLNVSANGKWARFLVANRRKFDLAFNALHGTLGEDGTMQGFLEALGIKYTGSGVVASSLGFEKLKSRELFRIAGLVVPKTTVVTDLKRSSKCKLPVVVKPNAEGSSVGVSVATSPRELKKALAVAKKYDSTVLVEEYLRGVEVTAGVFGNSDDPKSLVALPLVEIVPAKKYKFFNYEAKYKAGASLEIVPAQVSPKITALVQAAALKAFLVLGSRGYARFDFIIKRGKPYLLEANTLPGMTATSLFPQAALAAGYSFPQTLEKIINLALA